MTAFPESDAQTSLALNALLVSKTRRMASATAPASMMAPSTMASCGIGSLPNAATRNPLPTGLSSTAFTALDPMSSPTTALLLPNIQSVQRSCCSVAHSRPVSAVRRSGPGGVLLQSATPVPEDFYSAAIPIHAAPATCDD